MKPTNTEAIHFLPDYLYSGMDSAREGNKRLVSEKKTILQSSFIKKLPQRVYTNGFFSLLLFISVYAFFFGITPVASKGTINF